MDKNSFQQYRRSQIAELRPFDPVRDRDMDRVSISIPDRENGSPKIGDMIARNPANHDDVWLVAAKYFADNFEPLVSDTSPVKSEETSSRVASIGGRYLHITGPKLVALVRDDMDGLADDIQALAGSCVTQAPNNSVAEQRRQTVASPRVGEPREIGGYDEDRDGPPAFTG